MALIGNTIRLSGQFTNFDGDVVAAQNVKFIISDKFGIIEEITDIEEIDDRYESNYIIADGEGSLIIKIYGLVSGYPEVGRITIIRE